jgi:hypothetical protein
MIDPKKIESAVIEAIMKEMADMDFDKNKGPLGISVTVEHAGGEMAMPEGEESEGYHEMPDGEMMEDSEMMDMPANPDMYEDDEDELEKKFRRLMKKKG